MKKTLILLFSFLFIFASTFPVKASEIQPIDSTDIIEVFDDGSYIESFTEENIIITLSRSSSTKSARRTYTYKSSTGKTTALFVGGSVWGKPSNYCKTWRSTGNALEYTAYLHNDGFLALDEIGEVSNPKEIGAISYMLTNGKGKARLTKQITPKPSLEWKIIFLSSGEMSLKDIMNENGQKISDKFEKMRSMNVCRELERQQQLEL